MIGQRINESLRFWWGNLGALLLVTLPFALAGEGLQWAFGPIISGSAEQPTVNGAGAVAYLSLRPFAEGAIIAQLAAIQAGRARGLGDCLLFSLRMAPVLFIVYALIAVAVAMGWMAFILPGLWLYARLCLAPYIATLENRPITEAFRATLARTREMQWQILGSICLLGILLMFILLGIGGLLAGLLGDHAGTALVLAVITGLFGALINVLVFRFYVLSLPAEQE